uniref:MyTH4 domain-containing protein n=1 Tax=Palpitomonas bilix TaxID=652834 RepID=A0A7S3FZZ3_9EUKA
MKAAVHRFAVDDVKLKLGIAISERDDAELENILSEAAELGLDETECAEVRDASALFSIISEARHVMCGGIANVDIATIQRGIALAASVQYTGGEVARATELESKIKSTLEKVETALKSVKRSDIEVAMKAVQDINLKGKRVQALTNLYNLPRDKFLQHQLKLIMKTADVKRVTYITISIKSLFFRDFEAMFAIDNYSRLRSPDEYCRSAVLASKKKKERLRLGMLTHSVEALPTSLTKLGDKEKVKEALRMFKSLQQYMGDKPGMYPTTIAEELVQTALVDVELRDELYMQTVKQLRNNNSVQSRRLGWDMLEWCLSSFPPSPELENHLELYLRKHAPHNCVGKTEEGEEVKKLVWMMHERVRMGAVKPKFPASQSGH